MRNRLYLFLISICVGLSVCGCATTQSCKEIVHKETLTLSIDPILLEPVPKLVKLE